MLQEPEEKKSLSQRLAEKYYTPQEAMQRLGISRDSFNNYVKRGTIKKQDIIGKHGFFLKKEIDAMALRIEAALTTQRTATLQFRAATKEDLPAINNMAYLNFGELSRSSERIEARKRFLEVNPNSTFVLVDSNAVVASLDLVPLKHSAILEFRKGKRGWTFPNEMIEQFEPGHRLECIIIDFMTTTNIPMLPEKEFRKTRRGYASTLLTDFSEMLAEWGSKGIDIKSVDACGGFEDGKHILQSAGFANLGVQDNGRETYTLDIDQSEIKLLKPYKEALAMWKAQH